MQPEEILGFTGVKLLDSSVLHPLGCFLPEIYDCRAEDLPLDLLLENTEAIRRGMSWFDNAQTFSIGEMAKGEQAFLEKLNDKLCYYRTGQTRGFHDAVGRKGHNLRRGGRRRQQRVQQQAAASQTVRRETDEKLNSLSMLCKEESRLIRVIKRKDVMETLSREEKAPYERYLAYFIRICELPDIRKDYTLYDEPFRTRKASELQTNEKLVSAALTVARRGPVKLLATAKSIAKMLSHFYTDETRGEHGIERPPYLVSLYSDFRGTGYAIQSIRQ